MSGLQSALDGLLGEYPHDRTSGQTLDRTALLVAARNRLDAEVTQAAEHDGPRSMWSWLIGHAGSPPPTRTRGYAPHLHVPRRWPRRAAKRRPR